MTTKPLPVLLTALAATFLPALAKAQDPDVEALSLILRRLANAELKARYDIQTVEGFEKWMDKQRREAAAEARRFASKDLADVAHYLLAHLYAKAGDWPAVDRELTIYLDGGAASGERSTVLAERIRARAYLGRFEGARKDLVAYLKDYPNLLSLGLLQRVLPALQDPAARELATDLLERVRKHYEGEAVYLQVLDGLERLVDGLGKAYPLPHPDFATGPKDTLWEAESAPATILFVFRTSVPDCRRVFPFLKQLAPYREKGLVLRGLAPLEGARFWEAYRPDKPDAETELRSMEKLARERGLDFPIGLLRTGDALEKTYGVSVLPTFLLLDEKGRLVAFSIGADQPPCLIHSLERLLEPR